MRKIFHSISYKKLINIKKNILILFSIIIFLFSLCFIIFININDSESIIHESVNNFVNDSLLINSQISIYAKYINHDNYIISYNAEKSMIPSSLLKIVTSYALYKKLGSYFRFETKLYYDGYIKNKTLYGNLYLVGGGDPTLGSELVEGSLSINKLMIVFTKSIKELGIKKIKGRIYVDDLIFKEDFFYGKWLYEDLAFGFAANTNALSINNNRLQMTIPSKVTQGMTDFKFKPYLQRIDKIFRIHTYKINSDELIKKRVLTSILDLSPRIYLDPNQKTFYIYNNSKKDIMFNIILPESSLFAGYFLHETLLKNNVKILYYPLKVKKNVNYSSKMLITKIISPSLKDILTVMLKLSFNFYAEQLCKFLGFIQFKNGTTNSGIKTIYDLLINNNFSLNGLNFVDGSGQSRLNLITAKFITDLLSKNSNFFNDMNMFSTLADKSDLGFFQNFGKNTILEKNGKIKSGSQTFVKNYAGYLNDKKGNKIVFCILLNNCQVSFNYVNKKVKELLINFANLGS